MGEKLTPNDPQYRLSGKRDEVSPVRRVVRDEVKDDKISPYSTRPVVDASFSEQTINRVELERNQYVNHANLIMSLLSGHVRENYLLLNNSPRSHDLSKAVSNLEVSESEMAKHVVIGAEDIASHSSHLREMLSQDAVDSIFVEAMYSIDNSKRAVLTAMIGPIKEAEGWGFVRYSEERSGWVFHECGMDEGVNLADTYTEVGEGALVVACHIKSAEYLGVEFL